MAREVISPDGRFYVEFETWSEIGMGGPELGELFVNGEKLELSTCAIKDWIWHEDSCYLAFVQFLGRRPDRGCIRVYDLALHRLLDFHHQIGFSGHFKRFVGGVLEFHYESLKPVFVPGIASCPD